MGYTVSVNHPQFPPDTLFGVGNLGEIPNGGSITVSEDDERMFLMARGLTIEEGFSGDAVVNVSGSGSMTKSEINDIKAFFEEPEEEQAPVEEEPAPVPDLPSDSESTPDDGGDT